jgi:flagellar biosynthesis/type III secretory pathway chaperone
MITHVIELEKILESELMLHERLLAAARSMNGALKRESIDDVRTSNKEYDECTCHIEAIEEKRLAISDDIARQRGIEPHANLSRIVESLPVSERGKLSELRLRLRATLSEIQKTNIANRVLLTESLYTITKTFEFIAAANEKFKGYKQLGKKYSSTIKRTIINTVA